MKALLVALIAVLLSQCIFMISGRPGVADPVNATYDHNLFPTFYIRPQIPDDLFDLEELAQRGSFGYHKMCMLSNTAFPFHKVNRLFTGYPPEEIVHLPNFLRGTTYWLNEFMHVGHVHYDINLLEVLYATRVDRIVVQRAVCFERLCNGIGAIESFYKGYFTAVLEAFNHSHIPVYFRNYAHEQEWQPVYFSSHSPTFFVEKPKDLVVNSTEELRWRPLHVEASFFFETLIRRADYKYGAIPSLSKRSTQMFRQQAYAMLRNNEHTSRLPPLTTYFSSLDPPYRILFSFRGPTAPSRRIANHDEFVARLQKRFHAPVYDLQLLNSSDPQLDFETQLHAVASAHVVIANHGAFEGNMIYMRNSSLLVEIFGDYGNNEIHTFHRLALMFGVFYSRFHPRNNTDHGAPSFVLFDDEMSQLENMIEDYFAHKHFRHNVLQV